MSTSIARNTLSLAPGAAAPASGTPRRFDSARGLAAMLLAAAVAALVVVADQLIDTWADGHLFLGWVALWALIFAGTALFAGTARRVARRTLAALDSWSQALAEARAEMRLWELAKRDPRLQAELLAARQRQAASTPAELPTVRDTYAQALAPLGMEADCGMVALMRGTALREMQRHAGYLPYV